MEVGYLSIAIYIQLMAIFIPSEQDRLSQRLSSIQELIEKLPHDNKIVLKELAYHLCR